MKKETCKKCNSENIILIEYGFGPYRYDGISEIKCNDCDIRIGRWTGNELKEGEFEPPFGNKKYITNESKTWN